ncbi:MAG: TetR/AcrR family transcriptional regulator [Spirochaetota bacterium]
MSQSKKPALRKTGTTPDKKYHHGNLRQEAVAAALGLIESDGEAGLSLRGVARRLGVSSAALYRHFADREALLDAVAVEGQRQLAELLEESVNWPVDPINGEDAAGRLETVIHHHLAFAAGRKEIFHLIMRRTPAAGRPSREFLRRAIQDLAARNRKVRDPEETDIALAQSLLDGLALSGAVADEGLVGRRLLRLLG